MVDSVLEGRNVFFTGGAGTGKTFVLGKVVDALKIKYGREFKHRVAVTATTGIAATHVDGTTLNAALGIGAPSSYRDFRVMRRPENAKRIRRWSVLVIDECSMLSAEFFNVIREEITAIRGQEDEDGGIAPPLQLVVCGDFFQLPPVSKSITKGCRSDAFLNFGYMFQSPAWGDWDFRCIVLTRIFRQEDLRFSGLLNRIRSGNRRDALAALRDIIAQCSRPLTHVDGVEPTQIYSTNRDVDDTNARAISRIRSTKHAFSSRDTVALDEALEQDASEAVRDRLRSSDFYKDCMAADSVTLCEGAQVMLVKNVDLSCKLVNGRRGVVVGFINKAAAAASAQLRGQSKIDVASVSAWPNEKVPLVRFLDGTEVPIFPVRFSSVLPGMGECARIQVPLKLAWALTAHKSQGMTLDYVRVSLKSMFAVGQAYVALSRAKNLEGLEVVDWDADCIKVNPHVVSFYQRLGISSHGAGPCFNCGYDEEWKSWSHRRAVEAKRASLIFGIDD